MGSRLFCCGARSNRRASQESKVRVAPARAVEEHQEAPKPAPIEQTGPVAQTTLDDSLNLSAATIDYIPLDDAVDDVEHCHREPSEWQPPAALAGLEEAMMSLSRPYRLSEGFPSHMTTPNMAFEWASLPSLDLDDAPTTVSALDAFELDGSMTISEAPDATE